MSSEIQREHYDSVSEKYISARKNENHQAYRDTLFGYVFGLIKKLKSYESPKTVLEAMCGNADNSLLFLKHFSDAEISGFDYSEKMVNDCRINHPELNVFHQDILKFEEKNRYDIVLLIGGLHHVFRDTDIVLKKIHSSLKQGGYFINFEPTHDNFLWKKVREGIYRKNEVFEENTEQGFDLKELNSSYRKADFEIIHQLYPGLLGYILYYNPEAFPRLNFGNPATASFFARLDILLGKIWFGKKLSFASFTIMKK